MVRVEKEIRIHKGGKVVKARALFDTGSRGSYFSDKLAREIGYEPYEVAREVGLAVEGKTARVIGRTAVFLEVDGYILPEEETIGVVEGLRVDAIIGLNLMEKYGIYIENDEVRFKEVPPSSAII
jgi:hypothetical protein